MTPHLRYSAWGEENAQLLLQWLGKLRWPADGSTMGPLAQETGTTWVELVLSFILEERALVPIIRKNSHGVKTVLQITTMEEALEYGTQLAEQAHNFRLLLDNTIALQTNELWPAPSRRKVPSLYVQGFQGYTQGLCLRPVLPRQAQVAALLQQRFKENRKTLHWLPTFSLTERTFQQLPHSWDDRARMAKNQMRFARLDRLPGNAG